MSGGQPKTLETQTTSRSQPFGPAVPQYKNLFEIASKALGKTNDNPFLGNYTALPGPQFSEGLDLLSGVARDGVSVAPAAQFGGAASVGANAVRNFAYENMSGKYLSPDSNPFIAAAGRAAIRPAEQQFSELVLPAITDQAIAQGAYGGSGQDISQERAARNLATVSTDVLARMYADNYARERGNQFAAAGMVMPTFAQEQGIAAGDQALRSGENSLAREAFNLRTLPALTLMQAGEAARQGEQYGVTNDLMKYQGAQAAPWYGLGDMAQILASAGFRESSGTSTQPNPNYVDPITAALKAALGVGAGVAGIGGSGGFGLWGTKAAA